jgi:hypothetical protein
MASSDSDLAIRLRFISDELAPGLSAATNEVKAWAGTVVQELDGISERAEHLKDLWHDLFEAFLAYEMVEGLLKIAEAANEASDRLEIASNTAKNMGHAVEAATQEAWLQKFAQSARGGGYAIADMRDSLSSFATVGANAEQQQRLLADATDLAAAKNITLAEATHILVMAASGHVEMLSRYGIATKDATGKTIDFATAMGRLEESFSGDAEIRARGLEGAIGRLGNALAAISDGPFGQALAGIFDILTESITHLFTAISKLPAPVLQAVAALTFAALGFTALTLALGAAQLGVGILSEAFGAIRGLLTIFGSTLSLVTGGLGMLARGASAAATGLVTLATGEAAVEAPLLAIIAGAAALVLVLDLVLQHSDQLARGWQTVTSFLSIAWGEFVNNVLGSREALLSFFRGIVDSLSPTTMTVGIGELASAAAIYMPKTTATLYNGIKNGIDAGIAFAKSEWSKFASWLSSIVATPKIPKADWSGLGGQQKQPGGDQKAIDDALALAKAQIQAALDAAIARVESAKVALESSSTKVDAYKDSLPGGNPQNLTQALELYRLQNDEIAKERDLQAALLLQKQAYMTAAQKESALADHLPATDKDRVSHAIDLNKEATQHRLSAQQTALEYERIDSAIAKIGRDGQAAFKAVADETQKIADNIAKAAAEMATRGVRGDQEELRMQRSEAERSGQLTPANEALFADREQQLDVALAKIADDLAKRELELARENAYASPEELAAAQEREEEAHYNLTVAIDSERMAHQAYTDALSKSQLNLTNVIDTLAVTFSKLIPGLKVSETPQGGLTAIFDWSALLGDIIEKSKAYRDVQSEVTQVVKVLAQVLDAFRPVIDGVLTVFNAFGNAVIDIYNIFARLLRLIGIMIPILSNLSDNFNALDGSTAPLIQVVHDLPTQNELASGKIATLSTQPIDVSQSDQWNAPITAALQNSNLGGGLLGMLGQILAGVIALKEVLAVAGIGSGLNSGGGGILGFFKNLFNIGGSNSGYGGYGPGSTPAPADGSIPGEYTGPLGPSDAGDADMGDAAAGSWGDAADATSANTSAVNDLNDSITTGTTSSSSGGLTGALGKVTEGLQIASGAMEVFSGLSQGGTFSETLGGAGAIVGAIFGGPVGSAIGQALGSIIGSFFGPHPTAAKDPDMFESQTGYGQTMANLVGAGSASAGANGTSYNTQSSVTEFIQAMGLTPPSTAPGGNNQSASYGLQAIVDYLDKFSASAPPPGISASEYEQMQGTLGTGQISSFNTRPGDPNIGDLEVNGNDTTYSQLGNWMTEIMSSFQDAVQTGSLSLQQTFQELVASATPVTNGLTNLGNQLTAGAGVTTLPSTTGSSTSSASEATAPLTINMGDINVDHMHGVDDVQAISEAQAEATRVLLRSRPYLVTR